MLYEFLKIDFSIIIKIDLIDNFIKLLTSAWPLLVNDQIIYLFFVN